MIIRVVSGLRVFDIEDVSQVIVMGDGREPVSVSHETPAGIIITAHAAERDFPQVLKGLGMNPAPLQKL